jgi:putative hydrolase of the HAD superfamily
VNNYKHIFFDLDSTLWDFESNSRETLLELALKYNLADKGIDSIEEFISEYLVINERMWEGYRKGLIDKITLRYERFYLALSKYNITDRNLAENIGNDYLSLSPLKTNLFPHAKEVLQYLVNKYTLHIITNGFEEVQHIKINNCGIKHYFDQMITSERSGFQKPDIRIFEYSLNAVNAISSNSLMIGDSLDADIIGARNAGLHQVYFNPSGLKHQEDITFEIKSLKELMALL